MFPCLKAGATRWPLLPAAALVVASLLLHVAPAKAEIVPPRTIELRELGPGSGSGLVFADALQQASPWLSNSSAPLELDPEGNLEALAPGQTAERVVYTTERYPAGDYTLLYAGTGRFEAIGGTLGAGGGPGRLVVHVTPNSGSGLRLRLVAMDRQNPVRNVRLILPGFEGSAAAHPLLPAFVRSLQGANVIRFSAWMHAGSFAESAPAQLRPRVLRPTQAAANGAALEYMSLLANLTGANPWFSIPVGATDGYVREMANGIHRTLDPSLHPLLQYGDPNLFQPGSPTYKWALMAARNFHLGGNDPQTMVRAWYAVRSAQVLAIFNSEFQRGRVVSADSTDVLRLERARPNPNARLILAADASPFMAEHKPPFKAVFRPHAAQPLAAKVTLDLAGQPGVAIGLGQPLPNADPSTEGVRLAVTGTGPGRYAISAPADTTERVLRIYADVTRASAHLSATLEGKTYVSQPLQDDVENRPGVYTIVYRASHPGEQLLVSASRDSGAEFGVQSAAVYVHDLRAKKNPNPSSSSIYHNDLLHTGWNPTETMLTTSNVGSSSFGLLQTLNVDGGVLAQPLYVANYAIPGGGTHNLLIVATENASVYEFDADTGAQLNVVSLGTAATSGDIGCGDIQPVYGVSSTPAIDLATGTLYVVANTEPSQNDFHVTVHALSLGTLADQTTPVDLSASVVLSNGSTIGFNPQNQFSRTSLVWANNSLYVGVGSHCDENAGAIVGWLMKYDGSLNQLATIPTIEDSAGYLLSSIWMTGFAPAVNAKGDIFAATGNGAFDGSKNFGESVIHVKSDLSAIKDYFTPSNWQNLNGGDTDFGSGGVMLIPKQTGTKYPQLAVAMGKSSVLYLLDQNRLGHLHYKDSGPLQVIQDSGGGVWGGPAFFSGPTGEFVYYQTNGDQMHAYQLNTSPTGKPSLTLSSEGSSYAGYGGSLPVITSNGQVPGTAILWELERGNTVTLEAYDATNLAHLLFQAQAGSWPQSNSFLSPLVANGKVYVASQGTVEVFGLTQK
jgi:hypothetical protein